MSRKRGSIRRSLPPRWRKIWQSILIRWLTKSLAALSAVLLRPLALRFHHCEQNKNCTSSCSCLANSRACAFAVHFDLKELAKVLLEGSLSVGECLRTTSLLEFPNPQPTLVADLKEISELCKSGGAPEDVHSGSKAFIFCLD